MNLKEEYQKLVKTVKDNAVKNGTKLRSEDIAKRLRYDRAYFSTLVGAKGKVTAEHIETFKLHFIRELAQEGRPAPGNKLNPERAFMMALLEDYATRMAELTKGAVDAEVVKKGVERRANSILDGLDAWPLQDR
jgi:hypothetical protein